MTLSTYFMDVDDAKCWRKKFEDITKTHYSVHYSKKNGKQFVQKWMLYCHHNTRCKETHVQNSSTKNKNCPAFVQIKIKKKLPFEVQHLATVFINFCHNHSLESADALRLLKPNDAVVAKFEKLLGSGHHSPTSALHLHYLDLIMEDESTADAKLADGSLFPNPGWVYNLYHKMFNKKYGKDDGIFAEEHILKLGSQLKEKGGRMEFERIGDDYIVALLTPLMSRIVVGKSAGEILLIDSSGGMDKIGTRVFLIMSQSPVGGIPVGVVLTSSETELIIQRGFELYKGILPENSFGKRPLRGPAVIMTDDSTAERNALSTVWPSARLLLCTFHLLQALWRWLWDSKHNVNIEARPHLLLLFKNVVYAKSEEQFVHSYSVLETDSIARSHSKFIMHIKSLHEKREKWAICYRNNTLIRGSNTNNYSEAAVKVIKDVVLCRLKAFSAVQLTDLIINRFEEHYKKKLIAASFNRPFGSQNLKRHLESGLTEADIQMVDETTFTVNSERNNGQYTVDTSLCVCSCNNGITGKPCKHQFAVMKFRNVCFETIKNPNDIQQRKYMYWLATGQEIAIGLLEPLQIQKENQIVLPRPDECEQHMDTSHPSRAEQATNEIQTATNSDITDEWADFVTVIENKLKSAPDIYLPAIAKFLKTWNTKTTDSARTSFLHTAGNDSSGMPIKLHGVRKRRGAIRVQPTAISRRNPAGKAGRPAATSLLLREHDYASRVKVSHRKRPHSLKSCIEINIPSAK